MLHRLDPWLQRRSLYALAGLCLVLIGVLGTLDFSTGYELSFAIFYLVPIYLASWYAGLKPGVWICAACAATWLAVDLFSGRGYSQWVIPLWNTAVRFGFFIIIAYLIARLASQFELEARRARLDPLTGVMNRRAFSDEGQRLIDLALRHGHWTTLAYIDIDNFKPINDRHGHGAGDLLLQTVAATLKQAGRSYDLVGRIGGDEFALLLPETDYEGAQRCLENTRNLLARIDGTGAPVTCSIGAVTFERPPATVAEGVLIADQFMYQAKHAGKNALVHRYAGAAHAAA